MACIAIRDLHHEYRPGRGISRVTLTVEAGECFALLGRNGSGKSTLTRLILGIERPSSGLITVLGHNLRKGSRGHLKDTGSALDTSILWEKLSGWDNAYFVARSYNMPVPALNRRLKELFLQADLGDRAGDPVASYSYGMRQKLCLVQAFCHEPELLVLDEPTRGLDCHFLKVLADLVLRRTQLGLTTWIAGNDPDWISGLATRLAFIHAGKILAEGTETDLVNDLSALQKMTVELLYPTPIPSPRMQRVRSFSQRDRDLTVILDSDPMLIPVLLEWIVSNGGIVAALQVSRGTLRDAFLVKTGRTLEQ